MIFSLNYKIFWCKVNKFFVNKWLAFFSNHPADHDGTILATCVVTDRAKKKWIKEVLLILQEKQHIYITWCWVLDRGKLISVDVFYTHYPELLPYQEKITLLGEHPEIPVQEQGKSLYTRKSIVIQNWCDNYCSFCLSVLKRGSHRSRPANEIITEIQEFEQQWGKEIILTWINLAARWASNTTIPEESKFTFLLTEILNKTTIPRIRISSIWPEYLTDEFFILMKNPRFVPHFHLSLQHFSDDVLAGMRRNYSSKQIFYVLEQLRNLARDDKEYLSIWADLIVWFPWETEKDFEALLQWVKTYRLSKLHVFPFSPHEQWDTVPASKLPDQVPQEIKRAREKKLLLLWEQLRNDFLKKNTWVPHQVLIEYCRNWKRKWRTENYIQVSLEWDYTRWAIVTTTI